MINLDALVWHPRPDIWLDAKDTWVAYPNGYRCHIIYRESTKDTRGWQVTVVRDNMLVGSPMQHNDPLVIDAILRQVESGKLFCHLNKDEHMEKMLAAEKAMGHDEKDILEDFEKDLPVLARMMDDPVQAMEAIDRAVAQGKDPATC
jgi:hypothetical protein